MNVAVIGATGATGQHVVRRVLSKGHSVVAIARRPVADGTLNGCAFRTADVRDVPSLVSGLRGCDAVISCIGPQRNLQPGDVVSAGTTNILIACHEANVPRVVMQSGITISEGEDLSFADRSALRIIQCIFREAIADKRLAEAAVTKSGLDWVIVRPTGLKEADGAGLYVAGPGAQVRLLRALPFQDCADCLVRAATSTRGEWSRQIINVGL
jgi:uncharacterized protein YbjT (DUF2867 family)